MALLSTSKSLASLVPKTPIANASLLQDSSKFLKKLASLIKESGNLNSRKLIKQIAYICNYSFTNQHSIHLHIAEQILTNFIKTCRQKEHPVPESITKLLIITLINQSILYEQSDPSKAMAFLIQASKLTEQNVFHSIQGKMLKFVAKLREAELCIFYEKFDLGIMCAQKVLETVLKKIEKNGKKKLVRLLATVAINAFHKIGICEEAKGNRENAESAYENAEALSLQYKGEKKLKELDSEMAANRKKHKKRGQSPTGTYKRHSSDRPMVHLKIPNDLYLQENFSKSGLSSDRHRPQDAFEVRIPGRYYNNLELKNLNKLLLQKRDPIIMNSDNYFYRHIFKNMHLEDDIKLNPDEFTNKVSSHISDLVKSKETLKSKRRHFQYIPEEGSSSELVYKRINRIQLEFENKLKLQEIKMKSKLKSKIYRKLLKSINIPSGIRKRTPPAQALFFRQPPVRRMTTSATIIEANNLKAAKKNTVNINQINQEIEEQLEEIYQEIKGNSSSRTSPVAKDPACTLAKSTLKIRTPKEPLKIPAKRPVMLNGWSMKSIFKTEVNLSKPSKS